MVWLYVNARIREKKKLAHKLYIQTNMEVDDFVTTRDAVPCGKTKQGLLVPDSRNTR